MLSPFAFLLIFSLTVCNAIPSHQSSSTAIPQLSIEQQRSPFVSLSSPSFSDEEIDESKEKKNRIGSQRASDRHTRDIEEIIPLNSQSDPSMNWRSQNYEFGSAHQPPPQQTHAQQFQPDRRPHLYQQQLHGQYQQHHQQQKQQTSQTKKRKTHHSGWRKMLAKSQFATVKPSRGKAHIAAESQSSSPMNYQSNPSHSQHRHNVESGNEATSQLQPIPFQTYGGGWRSSLERINSEYLRKARSTLSTLSRTFSSNSISGIRSKSQKISTGKFVTFIRHAESQYNAEKIEQMKEFWTLKCFKDPMKYDAALSTKGLKSLNTLSERIRNRNIFDEYKLVVASPLDRAIHTAMAILGQCTSEGRIIQHQQIREDNWRPPDLSLQDDIRDSVESWPMWLTKEQCLRRSMLVAEKHFNLISRSGKKTSNIIDMINFYQTLDWTRFVKLREHKKKLLLNETDRFQNHEIEKLRKKFAEFDSSQACASVPFPPGVQFVLRPECRELLDTTADIGSRREVLEWLYPQLTEEHLRYIPYDKPFWTHQVGSEYIIKEKETSADGKKRAQELYKWLDQQTYSQKIIVVTHSSFISQAVDGQNGKLKNCGIVQCELFRINRENVNGVQYICKKLNEKKKCEKRGSCPVTTRL